MGNRLCSPFFLEIIQAINAYLVLAEESYRSAEQITQRKTNRHRNRGYAVEEVEQLNDAEFRKMFRMTREGFSSLLGILDAFLYEGDKEMARRSSGSCISKRTKLFCTLRWLAGGSYLDITFAFGVSKTAFFSSDPVSGILWPTIAAINDAFVIGLPVTNVQALRAMSDRFANFSGGNMRGCVTAVDGWVARTRKPFQTEVGDVMAYRNRHDCWGLVVMAGCDADCRFTIFSCKASGSTNDALAWELCNMKQIIEGPSWPNEFYVVGDEAFICTNNFLTPYSGRGLGPWKDSFNYHLSAMRQCVERSFALLIQRWGILQRPLRCEFKRWTALLSACAKLHNFCIDLNVPVTRERLEEDIEDQDNVDVVLNADVLDPEDAWIVEAMAAGRRRRNNFKRLFEENGIRRPRHSVNSRA